ncbi:hypothetical protein TYRP_001167 [Tyrophagus putrescentiae]|nr:hypothetical protein TYRP_001167 [Tyrophagus putrescentiae]
MPFFKFSFIFILSLSLFWPAVLVLADVTSTSSSWKSLVEQCNEAVYEHIGDAKDANSSIINCCTALWVSDCLAQKCQLPGSATLKECTAGSLQKMSKQTAQKYCDKLNLQTVNLAYCTALPNKSKLGVTVAGVVAFALLLALVAVLICITLKVVNGKKAAEAKKEEKKSDHHHQHQQQSKKKQPGSQAVSAVRPSALKGGSRAVSAGSSFSGASSANPGGSTSKATSTSAAPSHSTTAAASSSSAASSASAAPPGSSATKVSGVPMSTTFSGAKPNERPSAPMGTKGKTTMASTEKESLKPSISVIRAGCKL